MDEKDKQIERLFDDYASSLQPNMYLSAKAAEKMRSKQKPKKIAAVIWGSIGAALYTAVTAVVVATMFTSMRNSGMWGGNQDTGAPAPSVKNYSISEVRANKVDASFAADYLSLDIPSNARIFSESYYACYIKETGEFVYLKAVLGIGYNDGNIQMSVIAEKSDYKGKEFAEQYKYLTGGRGYRCETDYIQGEFVTMAYRKTNEYNYYVSAMGNVDGASDIAEILVNS